MQADSSDSIFQANSIRPSKKKEVSTIRYSGQLSLPNGEKAPLIIETTKDGYDVLLQDLIAWASWSPPASSLPESSEEEALHFSMKILYDKIGQGDSPLMDVLKLPHTRSTSKPNPSKKKGEVQMPLRRRQAAVEEYRKMIQDAICEEGPLYLEWANREKVVYAQSRKFSPLLKHVLGCIKKRGYLRNDFIHDGQLIPELLAAFLFEMQICTDSILPDCFERANLERPMVRQLNFFKSCRIPRAINSTESGGVDYFADAWRKDKQRVSRQKQYAKKCSDEELQAFIQSLLERHAQ